MQEAINGQLHLIRLSSYNILFAVCLLTRFRMRVYKPKPHREELHVTSILGTRHLQTTV